jgi:hypothetical protein
LRDESDWASGRGVGSDHRCKLSKTARKTVILRRRDAGAADQALRRNSDAQCGRSNKPSAHISEVAAFLFLSHVPVSDDLPSSSAMSAHVVPRHRGQETRCVTPGCTGRALLGSVHGAAGRVVVHSRSMVDGGPCSTWVRSAFATAGDRVPRPLTRSAARTVPNRLRHIEYSMCAVRDIAVAPDGVRLLVNPERNSHPRRAE